MSKQIDPLRKAKYKKARKEGHSIAQSLREAKYAKTTAEHKQSTLKLVKVADAELAREIKASDVTVNYLIGELNKAKSLAISEKTKKDLTNYLRAVEAEGRFVGIGKESVQIVNIQSLPETADKDRLTQFILGRNKDSQG